MTKILNVLNRVQSHTLQECYEEFEATPKRDLLAKREDFRNAFEKFAPNLSQNRDFAEFFGRIYYEINCKFEFGRIYAFLKSGSAWLDFAKDVINNPNALKAHFSTLITLYNQQDIYDINEEFIYLFLKNYEKTRNKNAWRICSEISLLSPYLREILATLSGDYTAVRDRLLSGFDENRYEKIATKNTQIHAEKDSEYERNLRVLKPSAFGEILKYCNENKPAHFVDLGRGKLILETQDQLIRYLSCYGKSHQTKLKSSFEAFFKAVNLSDLSINLIDYGCGQALASGVFLDFLKKLNLNTKINQIILIEPSSVALSRGILHLNLLGESKIRAINSGFDELESADLRGVESDLSLHIFSNVLDLRNFTLNEQFYDKICANKGANAFICVSPPYDNTHIRLDLFYQHFRDKFSANLISHRKDDIMENSRPIKRYEYIFEANF